MKALLKKKGFHDKGGMKALQQRAKENGLCIDKPNIERIKKNKLISINLKFSKLIDKRNALVKECDNPDTKRKVGALILK